MKLWNSSLNVKRIKPRRTAPQTPQKGEGAAILHPGPFRSQTIRDLAAEAPHCMECGKRNAGDVVACHPNSLEYGKGMGQKAHDCPAYLCGDCHNLLDGRAGELTADEKAVMFLRAAYRSWVWLMREGHLKVAA